MTRLSICIATLNRADTIGQTLDSLRAGLVEGIEIVIVDGASTDGTDEIVAQHRAECPAIRYIQLPEKGGVDRDYCRAVEEACGEFCWLMTDDDTVAPNAIARIVNELRPDVDLVVVNAQVRDTGLEEILQERKMPLREDHTCAPSDIDDLFSRAADLLSFIGSVVIRRSTWLERQTEPYFGTEFIHVGVIFQRPLERRARLLAEPLVQIRYGNAQWAPRAFEIWMFKWPRLLWSFGHVSDSVKTEVWLEKPWTSVRQLMLYKARGYYSHAEYHRFLKDIPMARLRRLVAWAVATFPDRMYNFLLMHLAPLLQLVAVDAAARAAVQCALLPRPATDYTSANVASRP